MSLIDFLHYQQRRLNPSLENTDWGLREYVTNPLSQTGNRGGDHFLPSRIWK